MLKNYPYRSEIIDEVYTEKMKKLFAAVADLQAECDLSMRYRGGDNVLYPEDLQERYVALQREYEKFLISVEANICTADGSAPTKQGHAIITTLKDVSDILRYIESRISGLKSEMGSTPRKV